jgi:hypothetical protein
MKRMSEQLSWYSAGFQSASSMGSLLPHSCKTTLAADQRFVDYPFYLATPRRSWYGSKAPNEQPPHEQL